MNILFLTLAGFNSINDHAIYPDLLREFIRHGHIVYVISPIEWREEQKTHKIEEENSVILRLRIGNTQKTNIIIKGISTILIESIFKRAIKTYFSDINFDMILYTTPPITLVSAVEYVKKRDSARTHLLLKDIFPQNAVDIGMMSTTGVKGVLYKHFRNQEKKLYAVSDRIGCMSQANLDYVLNHNSEVSQRHKKSIETTGKGIIEVCPNSIEVIDKSIDEQTRRAIREKYNIPLTKRVFVYGGNLGKPQGISFIIKCLKKCSDLEDVFFFIVGDGTEYSNLDEYYRVSGQKNLRVMQRLPKEDYDTMVAACDVGMIFLDHRFTIPNFPSRLLSYLQAELPVLAVTDPNTDIRNVLTGINKAGKKMHEPFGWWCESDDVNKFRNIINSILEEDLSEMKGAGYEYMIKHYSVASSYKIIADSLMWK